ncbi:hypothetical protein [Bradyrhizobium sp. CCBAU 51753]|nr:hypothetical protein [Bradyrhizobium sp. CCBAU 51753]
MQDGYGISRDAEFWLAAAVSCAPALLIAAMMIASLIHPQFPG